MGRPSAVMRLQAQFAVRVIRGQSLKPVRQSAAIEDPTGIFSRLPETEDRREQLMRIATPLGKLAGAGISLGCLSRNKPFCGEQGQAAGQLQFGLSAVPRRAFLQQSQYCKTAIEVANRFEMPQARRGILASL